METKIKKTEKKRRRIQIAIFILWAAIALYGTVLYSEIPLGDTWEQLDRWLSYKGKIGQQMVFEPEYLRFFAMDAHYGRFRRFDARFQPNPAESLYSTYWKVMFCRSNPPASAEKIQFKEICAYQVLFPQYQKRVFLLSEQLPAFEVFTVQNGEKKECPFRKNEFDCGSNDWEKIKPVYRHIENKKMLCIFSHPYSNKKLVLRYSKPAKGTLFFGFLDDAAGQEPIGKPVFKINGTQTITLSKDSQFFEMPIDSPQLEIEATTDNQEYNHVCFNAILEK